MPAKVATKQKNVGKGKPASSIDKTKKTVAMIKKNVGKGKSAPVGKNKKMSPKKKDVKKVEEVPALEEEKDDDVGSDLGSDISDLDAEVSSDVEASENVATPQQKTNVKKEKKSPKQVVNKNGSQDETTKSELYKDRVPKGNPEKTIFVGNLPKDITKKFLLKMFCVYGKIDTLRLRSAPVADVRTPKKVAIIRKQFHPDRTNINAYIVYTAEASAKRALETNGSQVEGRHIRVSMLKVADRDVKKAVFIGNIPFAADEEQLHEIFESCGKITSVRIVRDKNQGIGKGFAYVNFETTGAVELALLKDGTALLKRPIRVSRCKEQTKPKKQGGDNQGKKSPKGKSPNKGVQKKGKGDVPVPYEGNKIADQGKVQKKKKVQKPNPKKKAAVETLGKSLAKAGKKGKK